MPTKRRGSKAPCEPALRALASRRGPSISRLEIAAGNADDAEQSLQDLMARTDAMANAGIRQRAGAMWEIIKEEIKKLGDDGQSPHNHAAVRAAFRIPAEEYRGAEYDSITKRLDHARQAGAFEPYVGEEAPKNAWSEGVRRLGWAVERRLTALQQDPSGWLAYQTNQRDQPDEIEPSPPAEAQPIFVDQLTATYLMRKRTVAYAVTERLVTARVCGVDHYVVRAYNPLAGRHKVEVRALLNCSAGTATPYPHGDGETYEVPMRAPAPLGVGQQWRFASCVIHQESTNEEPLVEIQVTGHGIARNGLTMRVQFEEDHYPTAAWWFADVPDNRRLVPPPEGHRRRLKCTELGYLQHTFSEFCRPLFKYGLGWVW